MQLGLEKRFAAGQSFQAKYQYTRSLDDINNSGGWNNPNNANLDYGNSVGLRRHWLVFNYIYELPFGRGRLLLRNAPGWMTALVRGWRVSGISTFGTGKPFSVNFGQGGTGIVGWSGTRADVLSGAPLYAGQQSGHVRARHYRWHPVVQSGRLRTARQVDLGKFGAQYAVRAGPLAVEHERDEVLCAARTRTAPLPKRLLQRA